MEYRDLKEAYYADKQIYWHDNMVDYINWLEDKIIDSQTNWILVEDRLPTREDCYELGFKELPHFTIMKSLVLDIGRGRQLSIGNLGTPNEVIVIADLEHGDKIKDIVFLHNYDYDGALTLNRLKEIVSVIKPPTPPKH